MLQRCFLPKGIQTEIQTDGNKAHEKLHSIDGSFHINYRNYLAFNFGG